MKKKLIILTTAIIRGNYHINSVGKFYRKFKDFLNIYDVYHIINIDSPENLKHKFNKFETVKIFKNIIPDNVNIEFILNDNPGFIFAYTNLMNKVRELNLLSEDNYYWWFEDDWKPINFFNIFKYVNYFCKFKNSAMMFTNKSPLGSFRGGPIMSGSYFLNFFNIVNLGVSNNTCDPERQVRRWLSGIKRLNGRKRIHREITEKNKKVQIIQLIINHKLYDKSNYMKWYYPGKYYNDKIDFEFKTILVSKNLKLFLYDSKNARFNELSDNKINNILYNDNIKYFNFYPEVFKDIGRKFNEKNRLEKWSLINHGTRYLMENSTRLVLSNKLDKEDNIRLDYENTYNDNFYKGLLLVLENMKINKEKLNMRVNYYSHKFGLYPNFDVFNKLVYVKQEEYENNENILCKKDLKSEGDLVDIFEKLFICKEKIMDENFKNLGDEKKVGILGKNYNFSLEDYRNKSYRVIELPNDNNEDNFNNIKLVLDKLREEKDFNRIVELEDELKKLSENNLIILKIKLQNLIILNDCDIVYSEDKYLSDLLRKINKKITIL